MCNFKEKNMKNRILDLRKIRIFLSIIFGSLLIIGVTETYSFASSKIKLNHISSFTTGVFDDGAAEIVAHDPVTQRLFVVNAANSTIFALDISDPFTPTLILDINLPINLSPFGKKANSIAVHDGIIAAAIENNNTQSPGVVAFFDTNGLFINQITVGSLPDMITFAPNGKWVLVANEGEPDDGYTVDPEGSVSIIDIKNGVSNITQADVRTADFSAYNNTVLDPSIRIFGPNATVAQDLEPEFITISKDSSTAYVTLQENNAIAIIDIKNAEVEELVGLGFKDHSILENAIDASNKDSAINISTWPVHGMYQPDAIASYKVKGKTFLITSNEGDSRDYTGFSEEERVENLPLDSNAFPNAATLQDESNLGRLKVTTSNGDTDNDGDFDNLFSFGARSFSIWDDKGKLVFDSGDALEKITSSVLPFDFNSTDDNNGSFDNRSDDKGPEPEGVIVGKFFGNHYGFIGLERIGGIAVFDITKPGKPHFIQYINTRDFTGCPRMVLEWPGTWWIFTGQFATLSSCPDMVA